ncbi:MAG: acyl carrier protein [Bacteriovoracaceae bacterium]|nr:acyl carrier protein [Bacteriovoracaceae bacterium]
MNEHEIFKKVAGVISPYVKNETVLDTMALDSKILEDLGVNSARLIDIVLAFEDVFNIEVDDEAADSIWTIGDAVKLIQSKV